ncbi:uncharacterized protein LOC143082838 [Mytilus galloprovincialis]|uniref:uncharacterized protein LOC143082838 n=1 Tax=Mytilus galloprovincialis TaxID=29158 RepID=UPI003F7C7F01
MAAKRSDVLVHPREREKKTSPEEDIEMLRYIFELVEKMVNCEEYDKDLQDELTSAFPNFMIVLQTAKRDLLRNDCGIVVAGETSAGKTSVINWIVGKSVFVTSNAAATGTVCRIRNSKKLQIKAYTKEEELKREEHPNDMKRFKSVIRTLTDVEKINADMKDLFYVDAYLPVPLLQGNVILVDTPGIGESDDLDKILLEFLPHAVSFMFIINANNAGGVCDDRLIKILRNIMGNRSKMPCFNTEDVMFLTNKWDSIEKEEYRSPSDDDDEEEEDNVDRENQHDKTFRIINSKLKKGWPHIDPKNIFRISMKQMQRGITSEFTEDYKRFEDVLLDTIYKNKNKRVEFYFYFIQNFIRNAERGTLARLVLLEKSEKDQKEYIKKNKKDIENVEMEFLKRKEEMERYRKSMVRQLAEKLHKYLHSDNGKQKILNPIDEKPIQEIAYSKLGEEVKHRIERGIQKWCESDEVKSILNEADAQIRSLVEDMEKKMQGIEYEMLGIYHREYSGTRTFFVGLGVGLSIAFFPFAWIFPVVLTLILNPIIRVVEWLFLSADTCRRRAEEIYDKCVKEMDVETLHKHFEESFGTQFDKVLEQLFNDEIPKKLETLSKTNDKLLEDYNSMRKKEGALLKLKVMIDKIQKEVENFREITKW